MFVWKRQRSCRERKLRRTEERGDHYKTDMIVVICLFLIYDLVNLFKKCFYSFQVIQKQARCTGHIWPMSHGLPTPAIQWTSELSSLTGTRYSGFSTLLLCVEGSSNSKPLQSTSCQISSGVRLEI